MPNKLPPASGWLSVLEPQLSKKAFNQFRRCAAATSCAMLDEIILPNVFKPRESFLALTHDKKTSRDHDDAQTWAEALEIGLRAEIEPSVTTFFTNALQPVPPDHLLYRHPSDRVVFGGPTIFTFEFDQKDFAFFEQQCAWMRSKGKKETDCLMGDVYRALSGYADFVGITVVWSGNKSFHIHIMFDPVSMLAAASLRDCPPRSGLVRHWQRLKGIILPILAPVLHEAPVEPDSALQYPDAYRRLPLGSRHHDGENFFGFPVGTTVPQLVMWEKIRKLAAPGSSALFFSALLFTEERAQAKAVENRTRGVVAAKALPSTFSPDELDYFAAKIRETFPGGSYPEFVRFEHGWSDGWKAMFRNHAGDMTPTSVMKEQYAGVHISGANPLQLQNGTPRLTMTLGESFDLWLRDLRPGGSPGLLDDGDPDDLGEDDLSEVTHLLGAGHVTGSSPIEQRFARRAISRDATASATRQFFRSALLNSCVWVKAPEGSGKTTQLMTMLPEYLTKLWKIRARSQRAMFAFTDYVSAEEKCAAFNAMQLRLGTMYRGIVTKSFSKLYDEARVHLGLKDQEITTVDAATKGCASLWVAIQKFQPDVLEWMAERHAQNYRSIDGRCPVFFTVHEVAEQWKSCTYSRLIWGRSFWRDLKNNVDPKTREQDAQEDTQLALLVHDEIDAKKVVAIEPAEVIGWVRSLIRSEPAVWDTLGTSLAETYASYERFKNGTPFPLVRGTQVPIPFEKAREIFHLGVEQWSALTLIGDGGYEDTKADRPLYRTCVANGHEWVAKPRMWWRGSFARPVADTLVVLTTEMLPTVTMERADPDAFEIYSLETPYIARDTVDVHLDRSVNSNNMIAICKEFQEKLSPGHPAAVWVISDSVKGAIEGSRTHISARGSNDYIGKHVLQSMSFMAPAQHEMMLALNAYTSRNDCVALWHLDRFNQTAGRNIGFRKDGNAAHTLIAHPRLYDFLLDNDGWFFSRYDLTVHLSQRQREHLKSKTAPTMAAQPPANEDEDVRSKIVIGEGEGEPIRLPASMVESAPPPALVGLPSMRDRMRNIWKANER